MSVQSQSDYKKLEHFYQSQKLVLVYFQQNNSSQTQHYAALPQEQTKPNLSQAVFFRREVQI